MDRNCFKVFWPGPEAQSVERLIQRAIGPEFNTLSGHILLFSPSVDSRKAVVSWWKNYAHLVLVNQPAQEKCGKIN